MSSEHIKLLVDFFFVMSVTKFHRKISAVSVINL